MYPWQERYGRNTLRQGMTGEFVIALQQDLTAAGYPVGKIDGIFGGNTYTAVYNFQLANGLSPDGEAGSATKPVLYAATH